MWVIGSNTAIDILRIELLAERCTNLLRHAAGTLPDVIAVGCCYRNGSGAAVATSGTINNLAAAGNLGLTTSGTITNNTATSGANL